MVSAAVLFGVVCPKMRVGLAGPLNETTAAFVVYERKNTPLIVYVVFASIEKLSVLSSTYVVPDETV